MMKLLIRLNSGFLNRTTKEVVPAELVTVVEKPGLANY
jgi:hypothetical protein